jgi:hypothetical protein
VKCFSEGTIAENLTETVPNWPWSDSIILPPADTYLPPVFMDKIKVETDEKETELKDQPKKIANIATFMEIAGTTQNFVSNEKKNEITNKAKAEEGNPDVKIMTNLLAKEKPKMENLDSKSKEKTILKEDSLDSDEMLETFRNKTEKNEVSNKEKTTEGNLDVKSEKNDMLGKAKPAFDNLDSRFKEEKNPMTISDKSEKESLDSDDVSEKNLKSIVEKNEMPKTEKATEGNLDVEDEKNIMLEKGKQKLENVDSQLKEVENQMTITNLSNEESLDSEEVLETKIKLNKETIDLFEKTKPILDSSGSGLKVELKIMTNNNKSREENFNNDFIKEIMNDTQILNSSDSKSTQDIDSVTEKNEMKLSLQTLKSNLNEAINKIINNDKLKDENLDSSEALEKDAKEETNEMLNTEKIKDKTDKIVEVLEGNLMKSKIDEKFEMMIKQEKNETHLKEVDIKNNDSDEALIEEESPEVEKLDLKSDEEKFGGNSKLEEHNKMSSELIELADNSKAEIRPSETDLTLTNTRELLFEATTSAMQEVRKKQFNFTVTLPINQSISNLIVTFKDDNVMTESRKARCHLMPKVVLSTAPSTSRMSRSFACFEV